MNARILVVDDDDELRDSVATVLHDAGYDVTTAQDGHDAIARLPGSEFDVVLTDLAMPGASGLDVLRSVKETTPETEVVLITAHATLQTVTECLRAGAFDFVTKPVRLENLLGVIERAVDRRRLFQASQAILESPAPESIPRVLVEAAARVMRADDASLMMPGADGKLYVAYSHGLPVEVQPAVRIAPGERVAGRVGQDRMPALIHGSLDGDARFAGVPSLRKVRSSIVYPLCAGERLLGVLSLNRIKNPQPFNRGDLAHAALFASQAVLALQNASLARQAMVMERLASMGQVAAGIAHEINNPITYVLAGLSLLGERFAKHREVAATTGSVSLSSAELEDIVQCAVEAHEGAARIRDIVRDIAALARADTAAGTTFDVNDAVRSAVRMLGAEIRGRAELDLRLTPGLLVRGGAGSMSQVFMNLLANASHAVEQGGRKPATIVVESMAEGDAVVVRVRDQGTGIAPEVIPRLFEPFFTTKVSGETKTGTGLGLAISREIVQRHRGSIDVESSPGEGATFTVRLPRVTTDAVVRAASEPSASPASPRGRVLLVDDEPALLRLLRRTLERAHDVTAVDGGSRALELIRSGVEFDVVLCDVLMPDVNGMQLYRKVQTERPGLCASFVFMTGCATQPDIAAFLREIPNEVLDKPEGLTRVAEVIARRIGATR